VSEIKRDGEMVGQLFVFGGVCGDGFIPTEVLNADRMSPSRAGRLLANRARQEILLFSLSLSPLHSKSLYLHPACDSAAHCPRSQARCACRLRWLAGPFSSTSAHKPLPCDRHRRQPWAPVHWARALLLPARERPPPRPARLLAQHPARCRRVRACLIVQARICVWQS
jgi:hypothetical protein